MPKPRFSTLAASVMASLLPLTLQAAEIEELIITGGRLEETIPQELSRYGNRVEVITGDLIQKMGFDDVSQSLQMLVPGLNIRPKNGPFDYVDASLNGSRTGDILWLIDGVRINNRLYNGTTPLDTVPAHMIERVEVLKGGQGIFYGTQSVGGVINIVTKPLQRGEDGEVGAGVNSNSGYNVNAFFRAGNEDIQYLIYGSKDKSDGYQPFRDSDIQASATARDRGYDVNMAGMKIGVTPNAGALLSLHYQRTDNKLDFASPFLNYDTFNRRKEDIVTLKYDWQVSDALGLFAKAYYHKWDTHYTQIFNTLSAGKVTGALQYRNDHAFWGYEDTGVNAMAKYSSNHGLEYIVGFDQQNFSGSDDVYRIGDLEERVNATFVQVRTTETLLPHTMIALGARRNTASDVQSKTVWNLTAKHNLSDSFYVQGNAGTSFRLPDAEQLFVNELYDDNHDGIPDDYFTIGNPNLKPEQSRNLNIGVGGSVGKLNFEVIGFRRDITDYIENYSTTYIKGVEGESFVNTNAEVNTRGYELITSLQITEELGLSFNYTHNSTELDNSGVQEVGIPESEAKAQLNYRRNNWGVTLSADHVGTLNDRNASKRGNYTVLDLSGYYSFGAKQNQMISVRLENLADKVYATRVGRATADAGGSYLFDHLGMERTVHASYSYRY